MSWKLDMFVVSIGNWMQIVGRLVAMRANELNDGGESAMKSNVT